MPLFNWSKEVKDCLKWLYNHLGRIKPFHIICLLVLSKKIQYTEIPQLRESSHPWNSWQTMSNKYLLSWKLHDKDATMALLKPNTLMHTQTAGTSWILAIRHEAGAASGSSRNSASDWLKWAFYHLWSRYAWDSS